MSGLRDRLDQISVNGGTTFRPGVGTATGSLRESQQDLQELRARVHRILINRLDLSKMEKLDPLIMQADVRRAIDRILDEENVPLSGLERERVQTDVINELFGLGPLEPLLDDKTVSDILVNGHKNVFRDHYHACD